jgi:hypothetical protein
MTGLQVLNLDGDGVAVMIINDLLAEMNAGALSELDVDASHQSFKIEIC